MLCGTLSVAAQLCLEIVGVLASAPFALYAELQANEAVADRALYAKFHPALAQLHVRACRCAGAAGFTSFRARSRIVCTRSWGEVRSRSRCWTFISTATDG